jgi:hypothetical protein
MENLEIPITYPLAFEIELDALYFIYKTDRPRRFKEILSWLLSQEKYKGKHGTAKTLLARALKNLKRDSILTRSEKSHKFVTYNIKNKERASFLLKLRREDLFQLNKKAGELSYKATPLEELHVRLVSGLAISSLIYERALCEARVNDDMSSFIRFEKAVEDSLLASWQAFAETIRQRSKYEIKRFFTGSLKDTHSDIRPEAEGVDGGRIIERSSWVKAWKANHYANLKLYKSLQSSFKLCLARIERLLKVYEPLTEEQITKNALEGLKMLGAKTLSDEEYEELRKLSHES